MTPNAAQSNRIDLNVSNNGTQQQAFVSSSGFQTQDMMDKSGLEFRRNADDFSETQETVQAG